MSSEDSFTRLARLLAADVDVELMRRHEKRTPLERLVWLEEARRDMVAARRARENVVRAADRASEKPPG